MEEKLTFTRVPRSIYWICSANLRHTKQSYSAIMDHLQDAPELKLILEAAFPTGLGRPSLEAQMAGLGIKGIRDRITEIYLQKLEKGEFPRFVEPGKVLAIRDFENRFLDYSGSDDFRLFMLGTYLAMKDIENKKLFGIETSHIIISPEVDEILYSCDKRSPKLDWLIVALNSLLKFWTKSKVLQKGALGPKEIALAVTKLSDKEKMIFLNDMSTYGSAIGENEFFLYQKV